MGGRWLFILLCAILVQLSGSEDGVDEDGIRLTTISPDWTTEDHWHGGENGDGSEFTSGKEKIRRVRSASGGDTEEQLKNAQAEELKLQQDKKNANDLDDQAANKVKKAKEEWGNATAALANIEKELATALEVQKKVSQNFTDMEKDEGLKEKAFNDADVEYKRVKEIYDGYVKDAKTVKQDYDRDTKKVEEAEIPRQEAEDKAKDAEYYLNQKIKDRTENIMPNWKHMKSALAAKIKESENINKTIKDFEHYKSLNDDKEKTKSDKTGLETKLNIAKSTKTNLQSDKTILDNNGVLKSTNKKEQWLDMTVDAALLKWTQEAADLDKTIKKTTGTVPQDIMIKKNHADQVVIYFNEIKSIKFFAKNDFGKKKVKDLVSSYASLQKELNDAFATAGTAVTNLNNDIQTTVNKINEIERNIKKFIETDLKTTVNDLKRQHRNSINEKSEVERKLNEAREQFATINGTMNKINDKIQELDKEFKIKNGTWTNKEALKTQAENDAATSKAIWDEKLKIEKKYNTSDFYPTEKTWNATKQAKDDATQNKRNAAYDYQQANKTANEKNEEKKTATELVAAKLKLKEEAEEAKEQTREAFLGVVKNYENKKLEVEALQKDYNNEQTRKKTLVALGTGLGITIAIIVLMVVGGVAFVLIKKRNKKKAADAAAAAAADFKAKEKAKIQYIPDPVSGLTILRKEGEEDRWVVMGEDIQVRGPLIHRRVHNNEVPLKHALDGQEGGDKIEKIFFAKELNEGFYIGEGVEIIEPDSVSVSEGKGAAKEDDLPINFGEDDDKYKKEETNSKKAVAAATADKKPTGSKKSSKSKRDANAPVPKIPPPPPPSAPLVKPPPAPPSSSSADEKKKK